MSFQNPLAFIGLLSVAAIIVMYLLRQKHREQKIPSIMLWERAYAASLSQRPWQKLRRSLLMALQIILALLTVFALAGPVVSRGREALAGDVIMVLDASINMLATDEKPNRFSRAKELMAEFVDQAPPDTSFAIISAGRHANIEVNFSADRKHVKDVINGIEAAYSAFEPGAAADLIDVLRAQSENAGLYVFSGTKPGLDAGEIHISVGKESGNAGITLLSHVAEPDRIIALVRVKNHGPDEAARSVALYTDDSLYDVRDVIIPPGGEKDVFFTNAPGDAGRLTARLSESDNDWLAADDTRYETVNDAAAKKCVLVTESNIFLENALRLMPGIDLYKAGVAEVNSLGGFYLYIYDGVTPDEMPDGHVLIINPPEGNPLIETRAEIETGEIYAEKTRFVNFISGMDFAVSKAKEITAPGWAERVLTADGTDLILAGEQGGRKIAVLAFDLHNSDLPLKKEFPVFIYNMVEWFIPANIVASARIVSGDEAALAAHPGAEELRIAAPGDNVTVMTPPFSHFSGTNLPGFYTVRQKINDTAVLSSFAVNAESVDISPSGQTDGGDPLYPAVTGITGSRDVRNAVILLCLVLLAIEWRVYAGA